MTKTVKTFEGQMVGTGMKIGIVTARFNDFMGRNLEDGAIDALVRHGVNADDIRVVKVPGSFEIPLAAQALAARDDIDAVVCLGVLIRGGTLHFELIANAATSGIANLSTQVKKPITFGVITTENTEQAIERSGCKAGNKGAEAALAAIEMVSLLKQMETDKT